MFIIFDFDGTLCKIDHRLHFIKGEKKDWNAFYAACVDDEPNWPIIKTCRALLAQGEHRIEIWSGRSDEVRVESEDWLERHGLSTRLGIHLQMREEGDYTPDDKLKESWFNIIKDNWAPDLVFDDRQRVVDMWRRNGITCAQVDAWKE